MSSPEVIGDWSVYPSLDADGDLERSQVSQFNNEDGEASLRLGTGVIEELGPGQNLNFSNLFVRDSSPSSLGSEGCRGEIWLRLEKSVMESNSEVSMNLSLFPLPAFPADTGDEFVDLLGSIEGKLPGLSRIRATTMLSVSLATSFSENPFPANFQGASSFFVDNFSLAFSSGGLREYDGFPLFGESSEEILRVEFYAAPMTEDEVLDPAEFSTSPTFRWGTRTWRLDANSGSQRLAAQSEAKVDMTKADSTARESPIFDVLSLDPSRKFAFGLGIEVENNSETIAHESLEYFADIDDVRLWSVDPGYSFGSPYVHDVGWRINLDATDPLS